MSFYCLFLKVMFFFALTVPPSQLSSTFVVVCVSPSMLVHNNDVLMIVLIYSYINVYVVVNTDDISKHFKLISVKVFTCCIHDK